MTAPDGTALLAGANESRNQRGGWVCLGEVSVTRDGWKIRLYRDVLGVRVMWESETPHGYVGEHKRLIAALWRAHDTKAPIRDEDVVNVAALAALLGGSANG